MKSTENNRKQSENKSKEDHLAPSNIDEHKNEKTTPKGHNLTHSELKDKLDIYASIWGSMDQYMVTQYIKANYLKEMESRENDRTQQDINYAMGVRAGLPQADFEILLNSRRQQDQHLRNEVANDAHSYYRDYSSLSWKFSQTNPNVSPLKFRFQEQAQENTKDQDINGALENLAKAEQNLIQLKAKVERDMIQFGLNNPSLEQTQNQTNEIQLQSEFERIRAQYRDSDKDRGMDMDK